VLRQAFTGGTPVVVVVALGFTSGGYFPGDWGLLLLASALVCLAAFLIVERWSLGRLDAALVGALACLALWHVLSATWSPGADGPVLESERTLVYAGAAAALLLALTIESVGALLGGIAGGIVVLASYGLASRLVPSHFGDSAAAVAGSRLDEPVGYANALGIMAVLAILLLVALALEPFRAGVKAGASALLVPLTAVLWLTLSRGAIVALVVGAVILVVLARDRGRALGGLLLVAPAPALAALLTARSDLHDPVASIAEAAANGHALAWRLGLLTLAAGAAGGLTTVFAPRLAPAAVVLVALLLAGAGTVVLVEGPVRVAERTLEGFRATPPVTARDLDRRHLLALSGSWRADYWRVAWRMVEREPLLGEGGGSFERWWLQERPVASYARDAHSLYVETLAEIGPVGLALLVGALAVPLVALRRASQRPLAAGAAAAYTAFLAHAGLDWDWEVPLVTLPALACAASLIVLTRGSNEGEVGRLKRVLGVGGAVVMLVVALVMHVGNRAVGGGEEALVRGEATVAADRARRAQAWMPWAAYPWQLLGEAQLSLRHDSGARASLSTAIERDPERWSAWYDLAVVSSGRARGAALARAERLNPLGPEIAGLREELRRDS
jgi:hypothetical protein